MKLLLCPLSLLAVFLAGGVNAQADGALEVTILSDGKWKIEDLRKFKEVGVTSVERYIKWNEIESTPGCYNWEVYDRELDLLRQARLKWVPFVIAGPYYVTPEFVRQDPRITFYRCLECGRDDEIPSLWCPRFPIYIEGWMKAFAERYANTGMIESVLLGITGGYGEAIYPSEMGVFPATMHHHLGMWCGDKHAGADFHNCCREFYKEDIARLNADWGTYFPSFDAVKPFTRDYAPSPKAWVFLVTWYRDSMTRHAEWWLRTARRYFGDIPLYLCTGGNMSIEHGTDFSAQAKVAAKYKAGLRVTNEGTSFPKNVALTRLVLSSTHYYWAFSGTEPASTESAVGTLGRLFNVFSGGARQIFLYGLSGDKGEALLRAHRKFMIQQRSRVDCAALYPTSTYLWDRSRRDTDRTFFFRLRERIDYDFLDERMIGGGALNPYAILLTYETTHAPTDVLNRIRTWVEDGGLLITINSRIADYDGQTGIWDALTGLTPGSDTIYTAGRMNVLEPSMLRSFKGLDTEVKQSISRLAPDSRVLLSLMDPEQANLAWIRRAGRGWVLGYWGPGNTQTEPGPPLPDNYSVARGGEPPKPVSLPVLFLRDALSYAARQEGMLAHIPGSLWLGEEPVFLTELENGDVAALNVGEADAALERFAKRNVLPAQSIVRLGPEK